MFDQRENLREAIIKKRARLQRLEDGIRQLRLADGSVDPRRPWMGPAHVSQSSLQNSYEEIEHVKVALAEQEAALSRLPRPNTGAAVTASQKKVVAKGASRLLANDGTRKNPRRSPSVRDSAKRAIEMVLRENSVIDTHTDTYAVCLLMDVRNQEAQRSGKPQIPPPRNWGAKTWGGAYKTAGNRVHVYFSKLRKEIGAVRSL